MHGLICRHLHIAGAGPAGAPALQLGGDGLRHLGRRQDLHDRGALPSAFKAADSDAYSCGLDMALAELARAALSLPLAS